ncbi:MAG: TrkA C-terminal domain-containing protein [Chloroflexia bacterium]|jgi:hypothetical protein|nr:TrkA C-terminal domain-containing protein [Chloroflexia bacterium]
MFAIISLLAIVSLSMLVVRIGAVALMMTGLSRDAASFQALSAFSRAGFTTAESELAVTTPERRKIIALLIRAGNAGAITIVTSLILAFAGEEDRAPEQLLIIVGALVGIVALSRMGWFNRRLIPLIQLALSHSTPLVLRDYSALLHLREDYRVAEFEVRPGGWLEGQQLRTLDLPAEGLLILGIVQPSGGYVGAPPADFIFSTGDTVVVYGREPSLEEVAQRRSSDDQAHEEAKAEHTAEVDAKTEKATDQHVHRSS